MTEQRHTERRVERRAAQQAERLHIDVSGESRAELGRSRGALLRETLREAYDAYAELFRAGGISLAEEQAGARACIEAVREWRPEIVAEFEGIAETSGLALLEVGALNARTEILALGAVPAQECSTVAMRVAGEMLGAQTWDWHIELDPYWHTHEVSGCGYRFAGVTEQGIIGKIGVNEAGLAVHFNILRHEDDAPGGVPMHVLANVALSECASVAEALAMLRSARLRSSSSLTLIDADRAVAAELTPVGLFELEPEEGRLVRTNHFQHRRPAECEKPAADANSIDRMRLVRSRLAEAEPGDFEQLVDLLLSGPGEAPLCRVADPSLPFGERWQTLCTCVTDPGARTIRVLDGMPNEREEVGWRALVV